jgi:DNA mismatch endonuclease (patch repair protein)
MTLLRRYIVDTRTPEQRSRIMSLIRGKDTSPELAVRSAIHRMGYRFRLHRKDLPGTPDITLPIHKKVIFVHGCFWHGHICKRDKMPKSRVAYWKDKIETNKRRDKRNIEALRRLGWSVLIVRECHLKSPESLSLKLRKFLAQSP